MLQVRENEFSLHK